MKLFIKKLKKGNAKSQRQLYDDYVGYLFRIIYRYVQQTETIEDILSITFVKIYKGLDSVDIIEVAQLKAWMKRIAINQSLMELRKQDLFKDKMELEDDCVEDTMTSDENLLLDDIMSLVMELPPGYRAVFNLYVIEGYKHQEIASELDISIGTSKSQLSKARKMLQCMVNDAMR